MATHDLKSWPEMFNAILSGTKRHELRRADRKFRVGDILFLKEFEPLQGSYTGRSTSVSVTFITSANLPCPLSDTALHHDFCILSIAPKSATLLASQEVEIAELRAAATIFSAQIEWLEKTLAGTEQPLEHASQCLDGIVSMDDEDRGKDGGSATCQAVKKTVDRALKQVRAALSAHP